MLISAIQLQRVNTPYQNVNVQNNLSAVTVVKSFEMNNRLAKDVFTSSNAKPEVKQVSFQGLYSSLINGYLRNKSCKTAIRGSKRPYLSIDKNLESVISQIKIQVNKKESINAWDINPNNSKNYIIYLHGFSQNITSNQPLYNVLKESDFGILAIDYRGYGKNQPSRHIKEKDLLQDVLASVKYLKEDKHVDGSLGLVGHSFGSYVAAKASNKNPSTFDFQVLVSPMISLEFWLKNVIKHPKKYPTEVRLIKYIPKFKDQYAKIFDIKTQLAENPTPTYIVQSLQDRYIRASKVNDLVKHNVQNLKDYIILPKGGHRMDDNKIQAIKNVLDNL